MKDFLFSSEVDQWIYFCYELPDPANPCRLEISFDEDGNVTDMSFDPVPGG